MDLSGFARLFICSAGVLVYFPYEIVAVSCSRRNHHGDMDYFSCPQFGDDYDERYCCGPTFKQKCCEYDDYLKENPVELSDALLAVVVIFILLVIGLFVLIVCCCCSCCYLARRRQQRGGVVIATRTAPTAMITAAPANQPLYQQQMGYQPVTQAYPQQPIPQPVYPPMSYPQQPLYPPPVPPSQEYGKPPPYYEP